MMKGILLVDKPKDWTSFDVVNYVRRMVAKHEGKKPLKVKVGHTGTLDPAATGLLVLCVSKEYTRKMPEFIKQDKTYEVELTLGRESTTGDIEGDLTDVSKSIPSNKTVLDTLSSFVGTIEQLPPVFSAVKIDGKRAYERARAGEKIEMKSREVKIYNIGSIEYNYPTIRFTASVSSGTYIRSLAVDIGAKLGTGAYMSALNRTKIGSWELNKAYSVSALTPELLQKTLEAYP
jgi:tRNA pseudouridine55 synthase